MDVANSRKNRRFIHSKRSDMFIGIEDVDALKLIHENKVNPI